MPSDLDMSKYPRLPNRAQQPRNKMSNDDNNSPNETETKTETKTESVTETKVDIKASLRRSVEKRGTQLIEEFHAYPGSDVRAVLRRKNISMTDAHKVYVHRLVAYIEQNLDVKLEVHEWPDDDGDFVTSFSIAASSLI